MKKARMVWWILIKKKILQSPFITENTGTPSCCLSGYPDIPWVKIAGLRHRLVHHYEDTNWTVICAIIFDVLPSFLDELKKL